MRRQLFLTTVFVSCQVLAGNEQTFQPPFGHPAQTVDLSQKDHESWRMHQGEDNFLPAYVFPTDYAEKKSNLWIKLLNHSVVLTERDREELNDVLYHNWLSNEKREVWYNTASTQRVKYGFDVWQWSIRATLEMIKLDPRKEYIDWAVMYCDMLSARKIDVEDHLTDMASGNPLTTWHKFHVIKKGIKGHPELHAALNKISHLKESDPKEYKRLCQEYQDNLFVTATPMMSGHMASSMLQTAEILFRHPELYNEPCPDFELPVKKETGTTYLDKAMYFFSKGLESMEFFSDNPAFWNDELNAYVNPRNPFFQNVSPDDKEAWERSANSMKPWNRAFAILKGQAQAIKLMKAIDADRYAPIITRYQNQINHHVQWWLDDAREHNTMRGLARCWGYTYEFRWAEDIGHAMATLNLLLDLYEYGCDSFTLEHMRSVAVNMLNVAYIPTEKGYGHYVEALDSTEGSGLHYLLETLSLSSYHPEFWPVMSAAISSYGVPDKTPCGNWLGLLDGRSRYRELAKQEQEYLTKYPDANKPPVFEKYPRQRIELKEGTAAGTLVAMLKATDPDPKQNVSYWIVDGNRGQQFKLDSTSGELTVHPKNSLDSNVQGDYTLTLAATDDAARRKRSEISVNIHINSPEVELNKGLLCHYDFEKVTSKIIIDRSNNKNHASVIPQEGKVPALVDGKASPYAIKISEFGYIEIPPSVLKKLHESNAVTIAFWMKGIEPTMYPIVDSNDDAGNRILRISPWRQAIVWNAGNTKSKYDTLQKDVPSRGTKGWSHWCFTKDAQSEKMFIYQNGEMFNMSTDKKHPVSEIDKMSIGSYTPLSKLAKNLLQSERSKYTATMDEFRMYDRALSRAEAQALYENKKR